MRRRGTEFGGIEAVARRQCRGGSPLTELVEALVNVLDLRAEPIVRGLRDIDSELATTMLSRPARLAMRMFSLLRTSGGRRVRPDL
jgi:hypothetical protein